MIHDRTAVRRRAGFSVVPVLLAGLVCAAWAAHGQTPETIRLTVPDVELPEAFRRVGGVRALASGNVIVVDRGEKQIWLVDPESRGRTLVGRQSTGPEGYVGPTTLVVAGDSTIVHDFEAGRYQMIDPAGRLAGIFMLTDLRAHLGSGPIGAPVPGGADSRGRLYVAGSSVVRTPQGLTPKDSFAVLRVTRGTMTVDTVGYVPIPPGSVQVSQANGGTMIRSGLENRFAQRVGWAVLQDGSVVIVYPNPYHVERITPAGQRSSGPNIAVPDIPVSEADKREASGGAVGSSLGVGGGVGGRATGAADARTDWPRIKPPFLADAIAADPAGFIWVRRATAAGDEAPRYDVFDGRGVLVSRYEFPVGHRVVGFGKGVVFTARGADARAEMLGVFRIRQ